MLGSLNGLIEDQVTSEEENDARNQAITSDVRYTHANQALAAWNSMGEGQMSSEHPIWRKVTLIKL